MRLKIFFFADTRLEKTSGSSRNYASKLFLVLFKNKNVKAHTCIYLLKSIVMKF